MSNFPIKVDGKISQFPDFNIPEPHIILIANFVYNTEYFSFLLQINILSGLQFLLHI